MRQIREYVEAMFSALPKTKEVVEIKMQILEHMEDKFEALREQGMNENEALGVVISEFGSIDEIKKEFGVTEEVSVTVPDTELDRLLREYDQFVPKLHMAAAFSAILFILAPIVSSAVNSVLLLFIMVAIGVGLLIYFVGRKGDYKTLIMERKNAIGCTAFGVVPPETNRYSEEDGKRKQLYGIMPLITIVIYLILGFSFDLWHPGWLIFLLVPVIIGIVEFLRIG